MVNPFYNFFNSILAIWYCLPTTIQYFIVVAFALLLIAAIIHFVVR